MEKIQTNTLSYLKDVSGLSTLHDFHSALQNGDINSAKKWLQCIVDNKVAFHLLSSGWDKWVLERERTLEEAKKKLAKS